MNTRFNSAVPAFALLAALGACGEKEAATADTAAAVTTATATPTIADFAGDFDWTMKAEVGDSVLGTGTSHLGTDGNGYAINSARPADTTRFTAMLEGDSIVQQSAPYTDPAMPKAVGQVTFRYAGKADPNGTGGLVTVSPATRPDTVIVRARVEVKKR